MSPDAKSQDLVAKGDLRETELRLTGEITGIRGEIALLKWMTGFSLALLSAIAIKLFLH